MSIELGDQQIVHFLEDQEDSFGGGRVVLSPRFNVPLGRRDELGDELRIIARRWKPIVADIEGEERIGRRHNIPVTIIGGEAIRAFAYNLLNAIERVDGAVHDTESMGRHYRPHIINGYETPSIADVKQLKIDNFSLVETAYGVVATYSLEGLK